MSPEATGSTSPPPPDPKSLGLPKGDLVPKVETQPKTAQELISGIITTNEQMENGTIPKEKGAENILSNCLGLMELGVGEKVEGETQEETQDREAIMEYLRDLAVYPEINTFLIQRITSGTQSDTPNPQTIQAVKTDLDLAIFLGLDQDEAMGDYIHSLKEEYGSREGARVAAIVEVRQAGVSETAGSKLAESIIPPEKRKQVEGIVAKIREVYNQEEHDQYDVTFAVYIDRPGDERYTRMEVLQRQLSDALGLQGDESYQTIKDLVAQRSVLPSLTIANFLRGNQERKTFNEAVRLLKKMYSSQPIQLQAELEKTIDHLRFDAHDMFGSDGFTDRNRRAAGIDEDEWRHVYVENSWAAEAFRDLIAGKAEGSLDELVQAFVERNRKAVACERGSNDNDRKLGKYEQELASREGIRINYLGEYGDAILEEIKPTFLEPTRGGDEKGAQSGATEVRVAEPVRVAADVVSGEIPTEDSAKLGFIERDIKPKDYKDTLNKPLAPEITQEYIRLNQELAALGKPPSERVWACYFDLQQALSAGTYFAVEDRFPGFRVNLERLRVARLIPGEQAYVEGLIALSRDVKSPREYLLEKDRLKAFAVLPENLSLDIQLSSSEIGQQFNMGEESYTINRVLSEKGSTGQVLVASSSGGEEVVIKIMRHKDIGDEARAAGYDTEMFNLILLRDYQIKHRLEVNGHLLTPDLLGSGTTPDGRRFLITPIAKGSDYGDIRMGLSDKDSLRIYAQFVRVLEATHGLGKSFHDYHDDDIKWNPETGTIVVFDWNIIPPQISHNGTLTEADPQHDLDTCCIRLLVAVTKDRNVVARLRTEGIKSILAEAKIPEPLKAVFRKGLNSDHTQRYQSAVEFRKDLEALLPEEPGP